IEIRAILTSEPDKLSGGIGFGPRLLVSEQALQASGLLQPGSVVRWHYRLRLPENNRTDAAVRTVAATAQSELPKAGWELRSRANASPSPLAPTLHAGDLALALIYGLLIAAAFAVWPLGRAHDVPVSALFRDEVASDRRWPRRPYVVATILLGCTLAILAIEFGHDRRISVVFVVAAAGAFVLLRSVAALITLIARHLPRPRSPVLRLAIANIHRPGALTASVVISFGLCLAVVVTVIAIEGNLRRQFLAALPDRAPSFYFVDIPPAAGETFDAFIRTRAPRAVLERVPMLRGRIVAVNGVSVENLKASADAGWVLRGDRGITYG